MNVRERLPPTVVAMLRYVRTRLTMAGVIDRAERSQRLAAAAALRALPMSASSGRPRVLVFSLRGGWYPHSAWESVIAHALRLRGADVHVFNCGGRMPICEVNFRHASPRVACAECRRYPAELNAELGLAPSWLRDYLADADRSEIDAAVHALSPTQFESWRFDDRPIGALVRNSVLWFLRKSRVDLDSDDARVYRDFLIAGAHIARAAPRLLNAIRPDVVLELNGLFFAEQILHTFVPSGSRVVTYEAGWRMNTLGFDWLSDVGFADLDSPWEQLKHRPLTDEESATLDAWIRGRRGGDMQRDFYIRFDRSTSPLAGLGLDPELPTAVLFTNLVWDTAVFGRDIGFTSITDWLRRSVEWFRAHPDRQLVIRIHPAEDLRPSQESREKLSDVVKNLTLPPNVAWVPSAAPVSSYALMDAAAAVMVYTSTAGLEAALGGARVLVGARVYYGRRGFTVDLQNAGDLGEALEDAFANPRLTDTELDLARRFAYLLLFRFLHDVPVVKQRPHTWPLLSPDEAPLLLGGRHPDFDRLLTSILSEGPLVSDTCKVGGTGDGHRYPVRHMSPQTS